MMVVEGVRSTHQGPAVLLVMVVEGVCSTHQGPAVLLVMVVEENKCSQYTPGPGGSISDGS